MAGASKPKLFDGACSHSLMPCFEPFVVSPGGAWNPSLPIAASRAGAIGLLDLTDLNDASVNAGSVVVPAVERLARLSRGRFGLVLGGRLGEVEQSALEILDTCDTILLAPISDANLTETVARCRKVAGRVGLITTSLQEAMHASEAGLDLVVAKGYEAGGRVGEETTFVLLQQLLSWGKLPVVAWGGIGLHTAAACRIAGAAGVVLDWQLALMRESPIVASFKQRIARMDGSETTIVRSPCGRMYRAYAQPGMSATIQLQALADTMHLENRNNPRAWDEAIASLMAAERAEDRLWPVGQDAAFASSWAQAAPTVSGGLRWLREHVDRQVRGCIEARVLAKGSPLAESHRTLYPVVQGPMTRVSDVPEFAGAVADGGALPSVALALMGKEQARELLEQTRDLMEDRPWAVGILGFVERRLRAEQLAVIEEIHPPYAIIAGGRPDQAASLQAKGIQTYLHVPSPGMLEMFVREGARRFIFEGRECGGHVGPRTSFILWETMVRVLLEADLSEAQAGDVHVLFAGGIHDALSGAMVSAIAQPLVERGMKVGVLLGTAYLFTSQIVETGAVVPGFQEAAIAIDRTVLLETGPGHATRCADTEYFRHFEAEKLRLKREALSAEEIREELENMNLGRLRMASKGIARLSDPTPGESPYVQIDEDEQRRHGMYMLGQVAALRHGRCTIRELHEDVCQGSVCRLQTPQTTHATVVQEADRAPAPLDIAIIGMSCMLPGAKNVTEFWHNVLTRRDVLGEVPADRFDVQQWYDADGAARDKMHSKWGGFLEDIPFDPLKYAIPPAAIKSIEPMQLLALELVDQALTDAGYRQQNPHRRRTGVIFGVGGGIAELGASYAIRAMLPQFVEDPGESILEKLPEWTEDSFAGILLNVVAGRVANRFDFGGSNFTVDAACASSLAAIYLACRELADGSADMVITGGCDTVQNPLSYLCFGKAGALSPTGRPRTFDAGADGIVISEGLGAVVFKRREDAERDGDRIYAVIRAVAGGSDGRSKGIAAPRTEGQERTLRRAYEQSGIDAATVGLFEAHGTGTTIGDRTECQAVRLLLGRYGAAPHSVAIGSVKSMIGHTKCTAGVAGLMKAALALHHRVLPPTLHVETPNPDAGLDDGPLYVNSELRPWIRGEHPRRAAVSSFGFGGSNFHAILEEYDDAPLSGDLQSPDRHRPSELFVIAGTSRADLTSRVRNLSAEIQRFLEAGATPDLADLAFTLHGRQPPASPTHRAALVATSVAELREQLSALAVLLANGNGDQADLHKGIYYTDRASGADTPLAFLFPGQGSQFPDMMRDLAVTYSEVAACFETADETLRGCYDHPLSRYIFPPPQFTDKERQKAFEALKATDITQPALGACGVAMLRLLAAFGVKPAMAAGHSYGELIALHAAGSIDERMLYTLSRQRGQAILGMNPRSNDVDLGQMLAVRATEAVVRAAVEACDDTWIANLNSKQQIIVSGTKDGLSRLAKKLDADGIDVTPIPVACAFHSPLMAPARDRFAEVLGRIKFKPFALPAYSNTTGGLYPDSPQGIRELLAEQLVREVRFANEIEAMYEAGARVFIEVGPKNVLTKLVTETLAERPHVAVATDVKGLDGVTQLHHALAELIAHGVRVNTDRLYEGRKLSRLDLTGSQVSEPAPHIWLVNGGYARPITDPPRVPSPKAKTRRAESRAALPAPPSKAAKASTPSKVPSEIPSETRSAAAATSAAQDDAFAQFQETMRRFLETQQAVMEAYLGHAPERATAPPLEASSPDTHEMSSSAQQASPEEVPVEPSAPMAEETAPADASLKDRLIEIVSGRTGYPPEMLDLDANMEGDLGIDSIKRVEIIGAFRRAVLPAMQEPPSSFVERMTAAGTMGEILNVVADVLSKGDTPPPPAEEPSAAQPETEPPASVDERHTDVEHCPRCVVTAAEAMLDDGAELRLPVGVLILTDDGQGLARSLLGSIESHGGRAVILDTNQLTSRESTEAAVAGIRQQHKTIGGVVHLLPLREAPSFPGISEADWKTLADAELQSMLFLLQAVAPELNESGDPAVLVAAVTTGGGDFDPAGEHEAVYPWRGGLAGLLKTAAKEWPHARFRAVDTDELPDPDALLREFSSDGPVDVGYRRGRRFTLEVSRGDLPDAPPPVPGVGLDADSVVLVTGGARGITAQIAHEIALQAKASMILLGRSPLPVEEDSTTATIKDAAALRKTIIVRMRKDNGDVPAAKDVERKLARLLSAREIRRTLATISDTGARVEYVSCDVRDRNALTAVVNDVQKRYGGIDAVIHGAGVIEDKRILDKTADSFERVVATKVQPVLTMVDVLDPDRLKLFMLFSSVAGFFGNPGQADYAAANETLNRMARRLRRLWPGKVVAMNWGPWSGAGMVSLEVARQFESRGVGMVSVLAGRRAAWLEVLHPQSADARVLVGPGPWVPTADRRSPSPTVIAVRTPFLAGKQVTGTPGGVFETGVVLDPDADPWLQDHRIDDKPVLPFAVALEMMVELAAAAETSWHVTRISDIRLFSGVVVDRTGREIFLRAEPIERDAEDARYRVRITDTDQSGLPLYECIVRLSAHAVSAPDAPPVEPICENSPLSAADAYDRWLFHGPAFQAIQNLRGVSTVGIDATLDPSCWRRCVGDHAKYGWLIDPVVLDAGPQLAILWSRAVHDTTPLPNRMQAYHRYGPIGPGPIEALFRVARESNGSTYKADVWLIRDGKVLGLIEGLEGAGTAQLNRTAEGARG